jgi:hypothetical protein
MRPTRTTTLAIVTVVCAAVSWLLLKAVYEHLPLLPWTGVPALLVAALAQAWTGRDLKARIAGRRGLKPAAPLFVSRMVALAKASSLAAAVIAGLALGFVIYLSGSLNETVPRQDAGTAAVTFAAAVVLACAALYLEYCCRVPDAPDHDQSDERARPS